jgi:predicted pyridoxine 5'-phosphate oxidase superfamily flavin-nucleotide-binding protein
MLDYLNEEMQRFIEEQEFAFIASADARGECDCSFRAGPQGFVQVLDERTIAYPEYRGNGVHSSVGNILENPHIGIIFIDCFVHTVGLHVNGKALALSPEEFSGRFNLPRSYNAEVEATAGRRPEMWIVVEVEEAYIHCSKHIPLLARRDKVVEWGTDDVRKKGGDFFRARDCPRPWADLSTKDSKRE